MPRPPDLVFILLDDLGARDLSVYGSSFYETPHLDRLAAEGMLFTDAYAACPVCSPTRASYLTGRYPARVGLTAYIGDHARGALLETPYVDHLPLSEYSLPRALRDGGYTTWHVGKWHLGGEAYWPLHHGYDVNVAGCAMGHPHRGYFAPYGIPTLADGPDGEYLTDRLTDEALRLVERRDDRPFFLSLCHYAVHTPIQAPAPLVAKYRDKAHDLGLDQLNPLEEGEPFPTEHKRHQRVQRRRFQSDPGYAAMMENLDTNIGRLLDGLDADNTLVIFTSDNGGLATSEGSPTCNAPLAEGKGWMYEGGTREPLLVRWPGVVRPGSRCGVPVTTPDFYPTLLAAAGRPPRPEQHLDGLSLLPLLTETGGLARDGIYWHYPHYGNQGGTPGCSVRSGDWKLIEFFETGRVELYNLAEDVGETHDLAGERPELAAALRERLANWRVDVQARVPERNPDW